MDAKTTNDCFNNLSRLEWSDDAYTLLQLIDSLEMPQIVKIMRSHTNDLKQNDFILLQSVYDRYVLLGQQLDRNQIPQDISYLIPDWYRAQCRVVSNNPRIQKQFWNFQGATEINRFDLPREINFLVETPIYQLTQRLGNNRMEWKRVCLKRNTRLTATNLNQYSINGQSQGACFIMSDRAGRQYLLPTAYNIKFSVKIQQDEYNNSYFDHKKTFTLPEVITRYELPINVEFTPSADTANTIPQNKLPPGPVKLSAVAIAKSLIGVLFNTQTRTHRFVELSPASPIDLSIPKCLQKGLKDPNVSLSPREEEQYNTYNSTRETILNSYHKNCELYKYDLRSSYPEEKDAMAKIYDLGRKFKDEEAHLISENYLLNLNSNEVQNPDAKIPFINLKNIFLRPNIDEGDPYDDCSHEHSEEDPSSGPTHDITALSQMQERIITDSLTPLEQK